MQMCQENDVCQNGHWEIIFASVLKHSFIPSLLLPCSCCNAHNIISPSMRAIYLYLKLCVWGMHFFSYQTTGLQACDWDAVRHPLVHRVSFDHDQWKIPLRRASRGHLHAQDLHRRRGHCLPQKVWAQLHHWREQKLRSSLEDTCQWWKGTITQY